MIAVTGANGLLGKYIVERFIDAGESVIGIKRENSNIQDFQIPIQEWRNADITDLVSLSDALQGVTTVIHAAACVSFRPGDASRIHHTNVSGTQNIVNTCLKIGIRRLIYVSSIAAFGKPHDKPVINESTKWVDDSKNSEYSISKYLAELEVFRGQEEGMSVAMVNPSVILAPANWNNSSAQIFKYVWSEKPFYVDGLLNYVDARDVSEMIYKIFKEGKNGKFIASAGNASIKNFIDEIAKRFNKKPPYIKVNPTIVLIASSFEWLRSKVTGSDPLFTRQNARTASETYTYDSTKAKSELGIQFRSLQESLDWCCHFYNLKISKLTHFCL
ncbi:MAG: NAD-dependent epimerase/dehydratase family protein [Flammeovirgaceae bacterium]|nr:NAD-dependent epimerase/dehydratase family protein [Flammeovirgaceae bacterium]